MKIGFDIHGVIDTNPKYFSGLIKRYRDQGHKVHIITGTPCLEMAPKLREWDIRFDGYFSIAEWCLSHSSTVTVREDGQVFDEDEVWNNAKANYCDREGIHIHVDDSEVYRDTFEDVRTKFFLYDKREVIWK